MSLSSEENSYGVVSCSSKPLYPQSFECVLPNQLSMNALMSSLWLDLAKVRTLNR